jgi:hypothetical protein
MLLYYSWALKSTGHKRKHRATRESISLWWIKESSGDFLQSSYAQRTRKKSHDFARSSPEYSKMIGWKLYPPEIALCLYFATFARYLSSYCLFPWLLAAARVDGTWRTPSREPFRKLAKVTSRSCNLGKLQLPLQLCFVIVRQWLSSDSPALKQSTTLVKRVSSSVSWNAQTNSSINHPSKNAHITVRRNSQ